MNYNRTYLKGRINAAIKNKIGMLTDPDETCNQAVRESFGEINFRSAKRKIQLPAGMFSDEFSYPGPIDLSGTSIIDILPLDPSQRSYRELVLTIPTEFWRDRSNFKCAVDDSDSYKKILISLSVPTTTVTISTLDSTTSSSGTWFAFGDAINVSTNTADYVKGSGSVQFDISSAGGTTAGIQNTTMTPYDYSAFLQGFAFMYANVVDPDGITDYRLRFGTDASNYHEFVVTNTNENTPFDSGVNLLRFSIASMSVVGTPDPTNATYAAAFMTKDTDKQDETGYWFDQIIVSKGSPYVMTYYSQYGWLSEDGVYQLESESDSDVLLSNADEFDIILAKAVSLAANEVAEYQISEAMDKKYQAKMETYQMNNPDESLPIIMQYYDFI